MHWFRIVRILIFIALLICAQPVLAADACRDLFLRPNTRRSSAIETAKRAEALRQAKLLEIRGRLAAYFGESWKRDWSQYHLDINDHLEVVGAQIVFRKLQKSSSLLDLEIFETYLSVMESTVGHFNVAERGDEFYHERFEKKRPKASQFQERHWDWDNLDGYFFNSPSQLTLTKADDLEYLRFVLAEARKSARKEPLRAVLERAEKTWHLRALASDPKLAEDFVRFVSGKTYVALFEEFRQKVLEWTNEPELDTLKALRLKQMKWALDSLQNSQSLFDLYIAERYFALIVKFRVLEYAPRSPIDLKIQMTDWRVFESGLELGAMDYVIDFAFQNSRDTAMKAHLLRIMDEMDELASRPSELTGDMARPGEIGFRSVFRAARARVESAMPDHPAPEQLQTDLRIFSMSGYRAPVLNSTPATESAQLTQSPVINEVLVHWNAKLGKLQANVVRSTPLSGGGRLTVSSVPALRAYLDEYFAHHLAEGHYDPETLEKTREREMQLLLARTAFIVFQKPGTDKMVAMIRIFNGSPLAFLDGQLQSQYNQGDEQTFIEWEFPGVTLPARSEGIPVHEIGRLYALKELEANSFGLIMARVADYFENMRVHGVVYMDVNRAVKVYHVRNGARVVYEPHELPLKEGAEPEWILDVSTDQIVHQFRNPVYESPKFRKPHGTGESRP